jgi:Alcohol dehydrogenase transcription factor Myb/SANT-like
MGRVNSGSNKAAKEAFEQKMIELVKNRPQIFKSSHKDHKNSVVVGNCWTWVLEQLGGNSFVNTGK